MRLKPKEYEIRCGGSITKIEIPSEVLLTSRRLFCIAWREELKMRGTIEVIKFFESREYRKNFIEKEELINYVKFRGKVKENQIFLSKKFFRNERTVIMCNDDEKGIEVMTVDHWKMRAMNWSDEIAKDMDELEKNGYSLWKID